MKSSSLNKNDFQKFETNSEATKDKNNEELYPYNNSSNSAMHFNKSNYQSI